jgi:hypothetical protein
MKILGLLAIKNHLQSFKSSTPINKLDFSLLAFFYKQIFSSISKNYALFVWVV